MALVSDLVAKGVPPRAAESLGETYISIQATNSNPAVTASLVYIPSVSGGTPGITIPKIGLSKTKKHVILNASAVSINVFVGDTASEQFLYFNGLIGAGATSVIIGAGKSGTIVKATDTRWMAY